MNSETLLNAIGNIDDDLIEDARTPRRVWGWKHFTAIAAALALLISCLLFAGIFKKDAPSIISLSAPPFEQGFVGNPALIDNLDPLFTSRISPNVSFTAKAVETLPDTYHFIGGQNKTFRLVQMKLINSFGSNFLVDSFYYILPEAYLTDLTQYDALVITSTQQLGYEQHILYNDTAGQLQAMDKVIIGSSYSTIAAFTDGVFDVSLWTSTQYWKSHVFDKSTPPYGQSLEEYEKSHSHCSYYAVIPRINAKNIDVSYALDYVKPFENGIFIPQCDVTLNGATYRRYANGYPTNETVSINMYGATYSKFQFTDDDLYTLPDLASGLKSVNAAYGAGQITPPHLKGWQDMQLLEYAIFGWYAKTESGIYGVIRVSWAYDNTDNNVDTFDVYDDQYYIIELGSTAYRSIESDALISLLNGSKDFILGTDGYNENGRIPSLNNVFY